jgi:hypothetical protein
MVDNGFFLSGPEPMLWRPDLDHTRLRREAVVESVLPEAAPFTFIGTAVAVMIGAWAGVVIAALILGLAALVAVSTYRCWGLDCTRPGWTRHRRDRGNGQWYYRPGDFTGLPEHCRREVERLFAALTAFDEPTVLAWLPDTDRLEVHRAAWQLLDCLRATLPTRGVLARVDPDLAGDNVAQLARYQLVRLDATIAAGVSAVCDTSAFVSDLAARITAPRRRAALHHDLSSVRLPNPPAVAELSEDIQGRVQAVHEVLDLAGTTP